MIPGIESFKTDVKAIINDEALSETEKIEAIDLLLNPIYSYGLIFSDGQQITFSDNQTIQYEVN